MKHLLPSLLDIGIQADSKGNFRMARKMFRAALQDINRRAHFTADHARHAIHSTKPLTTRMEKSMELAVAIAVTYCNEGNYVRAGIWYDSALQHAENFFGAHSLKVAFLLAKRARVYVLQGRMAQFDECFEKLKRIYLLSSETDISLLRAPLSEVARTLSNCGAVVQVAQVADLVTQIEQLDSEDLLPNNPHKLAS